MQLVIFYLYFMFHTCLQTFDEIWYKAFVWKTTPAKESAAAAPAVHST
jgi:hypothetical protein